MKVTNCLNEDDAATNMVFVNPVDSGAAYVTIGNFIYRCCPDQGVEEGHIAMSAIQRRAAGVFPGDDVDIQDFLVPMRDFSVRALTIEAEWLRNPGNMPRPDLSQLASIFRSKFTGHVLARDQILVMRYGETWIHCRVKTPTRGLVTVQTEVGLEWNDSYA